MSSFEQIDKVLSHCRENLGCVEDLAMLVWRVQKPDGTGPYVGSSASWTAGRFRSPNEIPTPGEDGIGDYFSPCYRCGFSSPLELCCWFGPYFKNLAALGFVLATFEVPDALVLKGRKQVVFDFEAAKLLELKKLVES